MFFCLRIDVDYVPWDTPDAEEFGHGEPAMLLRIFEFAKERGLKFQFFVSNRVIRAFPTTADAILNEGHDLDWLCKHPDESASRYEEALVLLRAIGHSPRGVAVKQVWPESAATQHFEGIEFLSSEGAFCPTAWRHFPIELKQARSAQQAGMSVRTWTDTAKRLVRDAASRNRNVTIAVRPQALARWDPRLTHLAEIVDLATAVMLPVMTLREAFSVAQADS